MVNKKSKVKTNKLLISGPNNVIRLENKKMNKVIYIFGDYHIDVKNQMECNYDENYDIIDIDKFFFKFIDNYKEKQNIDLFIEAYDDIFYRKPTNIRGKYIKNVIKMVNFNLTKDKNKVVINPKFSSFRFHYSDIRNKLKYQELICFNIINYINTLIIDNNITGTVLYLTYLYDMFKESFADFKNNEIINKIKNKFINTKIKKIINQIFNDYVVTNGNNILQLLTKLINLLKNINPEQISIDDLLVIFKDIYYKLVYFYLAITDLFFMRRFLDKKYIEKGILYTGNAHLSNISYLLVKYCDFKITNVFYINSNYSPLRQSIHNIKSISELETYIKKLDKNTYDYNRLCDILSNTNLDGDKVQCVNLFSFPDNFK
jgi:hypothetical protein